MIPIMTDDDNELHRKKPKGNISIKYHVSEAGEFEPDSHGLVLCRGSEEDVLKKIATVHLELLFIHPYREGNGRTARLVATLMALPAGYNGLNWEIAEARFADYIKALQTLSLELMTNILRQALRH